MTKTPPTELLVVRHGEAHCNVDQIVGGPLGCKGLTGNGRQQIRRLTARLRHEHADRPFSAMYTTPLVRVRDSAAIIGSDLGLTPSDEPGLAETDYGSADGRSWAEVVRDFGLIPVQEPDRPIAPGAEPWSWYLERATATLTAIIRRHASERVLIVGHGETVAAAAHLFLRLPARVRAHAGFAADPASLTHWAEQPLSWTRPQAGWRWTLLRHNDTQHLTTHPW
jgi:probable phosphoglycerate mutase